MEISIRSLEDIQLTYAISHGLDSIFYEASTVREFASDEARQAFREKWLGSYLALNPAESFLALTACGEVAGYVVGDLQNPVQNPRYANLGYFSDFQPHLLGYPAHLHMNIAPQHRSRGLGARLIETFCRHAAVAGAAGVHVVTGVGMRNVGFYRRNGFDPLAEAPWRQSRVVMLGRRLDPAAEH